MYSNAKAFETTRVKIESFARLKKKNKNVVSLSILDEKSLKGVEKILNKIKDEKMKKDNIEEKV